MPKAKFPANEQQREDSDPLTQAIIQRLFQQPKPEIEITLMVKTKSAEEKSFHEPTMPEPSLKRCESVGNMVAKASARPRFMNSKLKPKSTEKTGSDIKELLEGMPKNCPDETIKIFLEFIKKGKGQIRLFLETLFSCAVHTEKRYQISTFASILRSMLESEPEKSKNPDHHIFQLRRGLFRKIQDVYEDQNLILEKEQGKEASELDKNLQKILFLDFIKAMIRTGVLGPKHIRNSLVILIVIFFNDNARLNNKQKQGEYCKTAKRKILEFRRHFTLELILTYLGIIFKGKNNLRNHEECVERVKRERYSFYEEFFCKGHQEQLIHNFSKDLLKIFNIFKENYDVSWLVIKEIFTVNNDYLIIMENDIQRRCSRPDPEVI